MATYWENSCSFGLRYVSWYKYLIVSLVFSHLGFWSGNLFLIAPFPDLCLLVPFHENHMREFNNYSCMFPFKPNEQLFPNKCKTTKTMKTYIRFKQHENSTPKHKTNRTTTEVSPWNNQ